MMTKIRSTMYPHPLISLCRDQCMSFDMIAFEVWQIMLSSQWLLMLRYETPVRHELIALTVYETEGEAQAAMDVAKSVIIGVVRKETDNELL